MCCLESAYLAAEPAGDRMDCCFEGGVEVHLLEDAFAIGCDWGRVGVQLACVSELPDELFDLRQEDLVVEVSQVEQVSWFLAQDVLLVYVFLGEVELLVPGSVGGLRLENAVEFFTVFFLGVLAGSVDRANDDVVEVSADQQVDVLIDDVLGDLPDKLHLLAVKVQEGADVVDPLDHQVKQLFHEDLGEARLPCGKLKCSSWTPRSPKGRSAPADARSLSLRGHF